MKRGRGSQKTKVLVMAESKTVEPKPGKKPRGQIPEDESDQRLESRYNYKECQRACQSTADLTTDDSTSYTKLKEHVHSHGIRCSTRGIA